MMVLSVAAVPFLAIVVNVLGQLLMPRSPSSPPLVFHWLPFVGSAISYGLDPLKFFLDCREKYGNVFTIVFLGRRVVVTLGAKGNDFVLGGLHRHFSTEDAVGHITVPVYGKGVVHDVANEVFMEQKRFTKLGMSTDHFRVHVGMIEKDVEEHMDTRPPWRTWQESKPDKWGIIEDVVELLTDICMDTAAHTLQGEEVLANLDKSIKQCLLDLEGGFGPLNFIFPAAARSSLPPANRRRDVAQAKMSRFYLGMIADRRAGKTESTHDILATLLHQSYRDGRPLSDLEIAHMLIAILMAGHHESASTASWILLLLAENPDVAASVYQEQLKHFGNHDGSFRPLTYDDIRVLPVLNSVIRETLRTHPPIHTMMRMAKEDVVVPSSLSDIGASFIIPKGYLVMASPFVSQMDPQIWLSADKWEPSRWMNPDGITAGWSRDDGEKVDYGFGPVSKGTGSPYQPFGAGRHRCIGEQFAHMQIGVIIATIVRRVELRSIQKLPATDYSSTITMPKTPCKVAYCRRKDN